MVHDASMLAFGYRRYRLRCMNKYDMGSWLQALSIRQVYAAIKCENEYDPDQP